MKHTLTPLLLALLTATTLTSFSSPPQAFAIPGPPGGVLDPSNVWAPYGPLSPRLQFKFYTDEFVEFTQFELGELDVVDWNIPRAKWASYDDINDFVLSSPRTEFGMFQLDFNHESSDWTTWGCDFQYGNSACGAEIRKAIAHLIDRPQWVITGILGGSGRALADPTSPAKFPPESPIATQQSWDPDHATINAFNIATDPSGFATHGSPDFCAAADHMIKAGIATGKNPSTCVLTGVNPGVYGTPVRFVIRSDSTPRRQAGLGIMTALNKLFNADVVSEFLGYYSYNHVFTAPPVDDWSVYTGGWSLPGTFSDHLRRLYGSASALDECEDRKKSSYTLVNNYGFVCVAAFDAHADAAAQTDNLTTFATETLAALDEFGKRALTIPLYSTATRSAALRDVSGKVDAKGFGYPNFWTLLNGRDDPAYTPSNPTFTFGGNAGPDTLRWGQKQGTTRLNIFHATTLWDFNVLDTIYDRLVRASPIEPDKAMSWMANKYTLTVDALGDTHIVFDLRANLQFHDGHSLTAEDIKFSVLSYRDNPSPILLGKVNSVKNVIVHGPLKVEIIFSGRSLSNLFNTGVPIIPKHLWDNNNDGIVDPEKLDPGYDPLAAGILIGSGPFVCRSLFTVDLGRVGTGCGRNADGSRAGQTIAPGGSMVLEKFDFATPSTPLRQYMRSYNPSWPSTDSGQFQEWSWADKNDNAKVDIIDVASVAACFGKSTPDNACPADVFTYWDRLGSPNDITIEAVRVTARLDETWVDPDPWDPASLTNIVPFLPL